MGQAATNPSMPALRADLMLEVAGWHGDGSPRHLVHDRLRHRFIALGHDSLRLWRNWQAKLAAEVASDANLDGARALSESDVMQFAKFLYANQLTVEPPNGDALQYFSSEKGIAANSISRAFNASLFLRIPLFRPQRFLDAVLPVAAPFMTPIAAWMFAALAVAGLYLVSRQWDGFANTYSGWLSLQGALLVGGGMFVLKIFHELGHAFFATRYGVKVPVVGLAFMLFVPVLYTDTTGAWRLASPRQRFLIDAGGMLAELAIASLATLFWVFMEDGAARSLVFVLASVSWVMSLAINLNPLMKFDGYHVLAGMLAMENLQDRGFALARWHMRERLFWLGERPPEILEPWRCRAVLLYAYATLVYRFFLQIGIALIVYHLMPKALAVPLTAFSLFLAIGLPLHKEAGQWWQRRSPIMRSRRAWFTGSLGLGLLSLFLMPLPTRVSLPVVARYNQEALIFAAESGQLVSHSISAGRHVAKGEILAVLQSPQIAHQLRLARLRNNAIAARLQRVAADRHDLALSQILLHEAAGAKTEIQSLERRLANLVVRAPFAGIVGNADRELGSGLWLDRTMQIALLMHPGELRLVGLAKESLTIRLVAGASGLFVPDNIEISSVPVTLTRLSRVPVTRFDQFELADVQGGTVPVETTPGEFGEPRPHGSWFAVQLETTDKAFMLPIDQVVRGVAVVNAGYESFAAYWFARVASVLIRESGA